MAGYSARSLVDKLGIKPGLTVYVDGGPAHVGELLDGAPYRTRLPRRIDLTLLFVTAEARLRRRLPVVLERTTTDGTIWVCWPKKSSGVPTEVDETFVRATGLGAGVVDVKVAAIDETWSGLKFVRRLSDR